MLRLIKPAGRAGRHRQHVGAVIRGDIPDLGIRHAVARADQPVKPVGPRRYRVNARPADRDRPGRVVKRRVEIGDIVSAGIERRAKLVADAELEAQSFIYAPAVGNERLVLLEPEKADRIVGEFAVGPEIPEQHIADHLGGRVRPVGVESEIAGVGRAAVLAHLAEIILTAEFDGVIVVHP